MCIFISGVEIVRKKSKIECCAMQLDEQAGQRTRHGRRAGAGGQPEAHLAAQTHPHGKLRSCHGFHDTAKTLIDP